MKIVYFIDHLRHDGTQTVLKQLVAGLAARGHHQWIVCLTRSWDASLLDQLRQAGAEVRFVGKGALAAGTGLWSTWRWLRREQFDVAVTLLFAADIVGRTLARLAGVPRIVSSLRARNTHYRGWQRRLARWTMRLVDHVVLNSGNVRDFAIREEGADPRRISVIRNGIDGGRLTASSSRAELLGELNLERAGKLIGSVGRLTSQKGFDILIAALALVEPKDVQLLLVGRGELKAQLRAQAAAAGLGERVHFAGYREDVSRILSALDIYLQPSRFEGMPNALLEAMAAGCPIIASAVDGIMELIDDGHEGWLVPVDDAQALARTINAALADSNEAERRGQAARRRAVEHFGLDSMVDGWERVLAGNQTLGAALRLKSGSSQG